MNNRMLIDKEIEMLEQLTEKAKFQKKLIRSIRQSLTIFFTQGYGRERTKKALEDFFFEPNGYWQTRHLTKEEFERALQLIEEADKNEYSKRWKGLSDTHQSRGFPFFQ